MHNFTTLDLVVVLVYLVGIGGLGVYQAVKIKSSGDYFAGGRKFNKWLMMMHALGTGTHADDPVGVTGAAYERGLSGIWYTFVYLFVTPFYWIIAPLFRRSRFITTADFFKARFGDRMALLYAVMGILTFAVNIGTLLKGTGTIASSVTQGAMSEWVAILVMTIVFVGYGLAGGLIATVVTESVQGLLIVVMSLLLVPVGLLRVGGFSGLHDLVSSDKFSLHAPMEMTIPWIVTGSIMMLIGIVSQPHIMEVCSTGKTEFEGRVGFTYGNFIKRFCAMGWAFTGVIVVAMVGAGQLGGELANREEAFGIAIRELLSPGLTGLMFAAILAAQMSSLSAFMVAASALLARNIYKERINPEATDRQLLGMARWVGLVIVALGVGFAFVVSGVAQALTIFWAMATFTGVFMWFGVLWRRANSTGAWVSFAVMVSIWVMLGPAGAALRSVFEAGPSWLGIYADKKMLQNLGISFIPAGIIALIVGSLAADRGGRSKVFAFAWTSGVVGVWLLATPDVGSFPTQPALSIISISANNCLVAAALGLMCGLVFRHVPDGEKLDQFYMLLKTPVGREEELKKAGVDMVYAGHSEGHPWELKHPRAVNIGGFLIALAFSLIILLVLYGLSRVGA